MTVGHPYDWGKRHLIPTILLTANLLLASLACAAAEGWRCAGTVATAYRREPGRERWNTVVFPVGDQRFLLRRSVGPTGGWELVWTGGNNQVLPCAADFNAAGVIRCGSADQFEMNRIALTFTSHLFGGTLSDGQDLVAATATGTCAVR